MRMVALENNLFILFWVLLALAVLGGLGWTLWPPLLSRVWRYFTVWWERDRLAEANARRQRTHRQHAERELRECLAPESPDSGTVSATSDEPATIQRPEERREEDNPVLQQQTQGR